MERYRTLGQRIAVCPVHPQQVYTPHRTYAICPRAGCGMVMEEYVRVQQLEGAVVVDDAAIDRAAGAIKRQWPMFARESMAEQLARVALDAAGGR